jgi:hypothetical protein
MDNVPLISVFFWIWLVGPKYERLIMLVEFVNFGMITMEHGGYWTWLTIQVKNS